MSSRRIMKLIPVVLALLVVASISLSAQESTRRGRKYKAPPPTSRIEVTVLRADDAKPIENASVIFTLIGDKGNMELKTNEDGKSVIDVLPLGAKMRLQVLAKGYQTYGQDYEIDKAALNYEVRLKRPVRQYSIYEHHGDNANNDQKQEKNGDKDSSSGSDKNSAPKDKPDSSSDQSSKPQSR